MSASVEMPQLPAGRALRALRARTRRSAACGVTSSHASAVETSVRAIQQAFATFHREASCIIRASMKAAWLSKRTPFPFVIDLLRESGGAKLLFALSSVGAPRGRRPAAQDHDSAACGRLNLGGRARGASANTSSTFRIASRISPVSLSRIDGNSHEDPAPRQRVAITSFSSNLFPSLNTAKAQRNIRRASATTVTERPRR